MRPLILQSDFGYADGAGFRHVRRGGMRQRPASRLRPDHDIPQYDIWEASYRLIQTVTYWPEGSVFVSVVDPGVGSTRRSIVVRTTGGQYVVTPDNGTLTHIKRMIGISEARVIDESINRLPGSGESYTFHGRDIYAYTGARLASGIITFEQVGPQVDVDSVVELPVVPAELHDGIITAPSNVLDVRFGSLWTNISREMFRELGIEHGQRREITICQRHPYAVQEHRRLRQEFRGRLRGRRAPVCKQPGQHGRLPSIRAALPRPTPSAPALRGSCPSARPPKSVYD